MRMTCLPLLSGGHLGRLAASVAVLAFTGGMVVVPAGPGGAATTPPLPDLGAIGQVVNSQGAGRVVGQLGSPLPGPAYVYAEDGTCPDGISVYAILGTTLTQIQQVSVGCAERGAPGSHYLAVAQGNWGEDCLLYLDVGDAELDSFVIAPDGQISSSPASDVTLGGHPNDLATSANTVFVSALNEQYIDELSISQGCMLALSSQNQTLGEWDNDIAVAGGDLVSANFLGPGDLVAYAPQSNGTLAEVATRPGGIPRPSGIAVLEWGSSSNVYTGDTPGVLQPPEVQGARFTGTVFSAAYLAADGDYQAQTGGAVAASVEYRTLAQADVLAGTIAYYGLTPTTISYEGTASLAQTDDLPIEMTIAGANLVVANDLGGDVEDCSIAVSGISDCHTLVVLPGAGGGVSGSTAVLLL
jgi:hypothetical protein